MLALLVPGLLMGGGTAAPVAILARVVGVGQVARKTVVGTGQVSRSAQGVGQVGRKVP